MHERFRGRIYELEQLMEVAEQKKFQEKSKERWDDVEDLAEEVGN